MNLRVDLILESEQRNASVLNPKTLTRLAAIVIPLLAVVLIGWQVMKLMGLKSELGALESRWQTTEPLEKKAVQLGVEARTNADILGELNGWRKSHVDWNRHLLEMMRRIPGNIQLVEFRLGQSLQVLEDRIPARAFTVEIKGRAFGPESEGSVNDLKQTLSTDPAFTNLIRGVEVPSFGADTSANAGKNDRVFIIRCTYREQPFE